MTLGGTGGAFVPRLWGSDDFFASIVFSTVGGLAGIWLWYRYFRFV